MWVQDVPDGGVRALAFTPDGGTLYTRDAARWVTAWDTQNHTGRRVFRAGATHHPPLAEPGFGLADCGRFLVADGLPPCVFDCRTGAVVPFNTGGLRRDNPNKPAEPIEVSAGIGLIHADPFAPRLLALLPSGVVATWNLGTRRPGPDLSPPVSQVFHERFHLTPFGQAILRHNKPDRVSVFDAAAGGFVATFTVRCPSPYFEPLPAPDGRAAVLFCGRQLFLWARATQTLRGKPIPASPPSGAIAFHPTEPVFTALNGDKVLTLFNLDTGAPIRSLDFALGKKVQCVAFSPDGLTCAVGGSNKQFAVFDVDL
ncbi:MAG TPA: hypothetical protein VGE74_16285 [Gemmata sp.]